MTTVGEKAASCGAKEGGDDVRRGEEKERREEEDMGEEIKAKQKNMKEKQ